MVILAVAGCSRSPGDGADSPHRPGGLSSGVVTWIVDGDTVDLDTGSGEITVRLLGVNAPDLGECFHDEATSHLIDTLKEETVGLEAIGVDQFGRTLAYLWNGDELVNLEVVTAGLATATTPDDSEAYGDALIEAEEAAYASGAGLWGTEVCGASGPVQPIGLDTSAFDPPGPDQDSLSSELVIVTNESSESLYPEDWVLRDESSSHRYRFPSGTELRPGNSITVSSEDKSWDPGDSPVWNNGGDMALLLDESGRVVARSRYP